MRTIINLFFILFITAHSEASLDLSFLAEEKIINILTRDCTLEYQVRNSTKTVKDDYKNYMRKAILKVASILYRSISIPKHMLSRVSANNLTEEMCTITDRTYINENLLGNFEETRCIIIPRNTPNDHAYELHKYSINLMDLPDDRFTDKQDIRPHESLQYVMRDLMARLYFATCQDRALSYLIFKPKKFQTKGLWEFYKDEVTYQYNTFDLDRFWRSVYTIDYVTNQQLELLLTLLPINEKEVLYAPTPIISVTSETMNLIESSKLIISNCFEIKENIPEIPEEDISMKIINLYDEYENTKSKDNPTCIIN